MRNLKEIELHLRNLSDLWGFKVLDGVADELAVHHECYEELVTRKPSEEPDVRPRFNQKLAPPKFDLKVQVEKLGADSLLPQPAPKGRNKEKTDVGKPESGRRSAVSPVPRGPTKPRGAGKAPGRKSGVRAPRKAGQPERAGRKR